MKLYAVYSDDAGKTWQRGALVPANMQANEVQMAELANGDIVLNARSFQGNKKRKVATSRDAGQTWSTLLDAKGLDEPECQGSMIAFESADLLYCGPNDTQSRRQGMLKRSLDGGVSWEKLHVVHEGFFAYSSIAKLSGNAVGVLFESDGYATIRFVRQVI